MSQLTRIDRLPGSVEEFITLQGTLARTADGGAAMMVLALLLYVKDQHMGNQCLSVAVDQGRLMEADEGFQDRQLHKREMQLIKRQIERQSYLPKSYIKDCTPENGYADPDLPYELECSRNPYSGDEASGEFKVFVKCSGASSPRPVTLKRDSQGIWKAQEWSSLVVGIMDPH